MNMVWLVEIDGQFFIRLKTDNAYQDIPVSFATVLTLAESTTKAAFAVIRKKQVDKEPSPV